MKLMRFTEPATAQYVCLVCLNRLPLQLHPKFLPISETQRRGLTYTRCKQKPPSEATALREDGNAYSEKLELPQHVKRRGQLRAQSGPVPPELFPDPDLAPQLPRHRNSAGQANRASPVNSGESFPDPDLSRQWKPFRSEQSHTVEGQHSEPWRNGPASVYRRDKTENDNARYDNGGTASDRPLVRWHSIGSSTESRPPRSEVGKNDSGSRIWRDRSENGDREEGKGAKPSWGRHLQPRSNQVNREDGSRPFTRFIPASSNGSDEPLSGSWSAGAPNVSRRPNLPQKDFVSFRPSSSSNSTKILPIPVREKDEVKPTGLHLNPEQTQTTPQAKEGREDRRLTSVNTLPTLEPEKMNPGQDFSGNFAGIAPDPRVAPLEGRHELQTKKNKKGKRANMVQMDEDADFVNELPPRRQSVGVSKKKYSKFKDEEDEPYGYEDELAFDEDAKYKKEKRQKKKRQQEKLAKQAAPVIPTIELPPFITVGQLATALHARLDAFIGTMEELGFAEIANDHILNFEDSSLIAMEYGYESKMDTAELEDLKPRPVVEDQSILPTRPPIVTIMGHVDHGKTTLLDYLRKSSVAASEHGGITQHIGAFSVPMASGKVVTFLDTPGHAAFLSMRQRGAHVTDIVVLVVAADDSVKPQTIEAIKHARAAKVPIIVAINKVDKDEADIQRVKQDLLRHEIEVEDFGGDVQAIPVSGKTGQGMVELEEALVALAETIDMRAEIDGPVEGWVLEATTKKAGRVATVLVRRGTLRQGDVIVAGTTWTRVRTLKNEAGVVIPEASPGTPVEVDGWRDQAAAGDQVIQAPTEQKATSVVDYRIAKLAREQDAKDMEVINLARQQQSEKREREKAELKSANPPGSISLPENNTPGGTQVMADKSTATAAVDSKVSTTNTELYILIKADVSGSAEALESSLLSLPLHNHPVSLSVLRTGVGPISASDVDHISTVPAGKGFLISFNQQVPQSIAHQAEMAGVKVFDENIIYKVIDNIRAAVEDCLPPLVSKRVTGEAEAAQVFEINVGGRKFVKIVGCKVRNGTVAKGKKVKVYRGGMDEANVVYDGTIHSLKSQKKDVAEMRKGTECGMGFDAWEEFQAGDVIQCYEEKHEKRRLT